MKKLLLLPLLLLVLKLQAQQETIFKIKYLPNHSYVGGMSLGAVGNINVSGNDTVIKKLAAQGLTMPLVLNLNMKMNTDTKTGAATAQGFPLTMKFNFDTLDISVNGNKVPVPMEKLGSGMTVYGHGSKDGIFMSDSVSGMGAKKDTAKSKMDQMVNNLQKNIKFPDHPMKIGESFTQGLPLSLPMGNGNMNLKAETVYTLTNIADGKAYFDVKPSLNMTIPIKGNNLTLTGTGSGKMVYSIKDHFATDYTTTLNLKLNGEVEKLQIDATLNFQMGYKYTITTN